MKEKSNISINSFGIVMWAFLLCVSWFGHFNSWWPVAFPVTFTIIVCSLYGIMFIAVIILLIIKLVSQRPDDDANEIWFRKK